MAYRPLVGIVISFAVGITTNYLVNIPFIPVFSTAIAFVVAPFLRQHGIRKIDTIVISHEHDDHCNGVPSIIDRFSVGNAFVNKFFLQSENRAELLSMFAEKRVKTGLLADGLEIKGYEPAEIRVLNPPDRDVLRNEGIMSVNSSSDVDVSADVIQVPHHGGFCEKTEDLVKSVNPGYAIISGLAKDISPSTIEDYQSHGVSVHKTHASGAVTYMIDKEGIKVSTFL